MFHEIIKSNFIAEEHCLGSSLLQNEFRIRGENVLLNVMSVIQKKQETDELMVDGLQCDVILGLPHNDHD